MNENKNIPVPQGNKIVIDIYSKYEKFESINEKKFNINAVEYKRSWIQTQLDTKSSCVQDFNDWQQYFSIFNNIDHNFDTSNSKSPRDRKKYPKS